MRKAAAQRARAWHARRSRASGEDLEAKQAEAPPRDTAAVESPVVLPAPKPRRRSVPPAGCLGACPFVDQLAGQITAAVLEQLPAGQDREAEHVAMLALRMARTPSRDPRWFEAVTALHRAATTWGDRHPAVVLTVDRRMAEKTA